MEQTRAEITGRQRWDKPFAAEWDEADLQRVLALPLFADMDISRFPSSLPLEGLIRNDARHLKYERGDIIVRAGDYGSSAYVVVSGSVTVIHPPGLSARQLGRAEEERSVGLWDALKRVVNRSKYQEVRDYADAGWADSESNLSFDSGEVRVTLKKLDKVLSEHPSSQIHQGELLGEVAALTRSPRVATVVATEPVELVEIRWQGFRDLRKYNDEFRTRVDAIYRERNLVSYLKALPYFSALSDDAMQRIAEQTSLESYGDLEWKAVRRRGADSMVPEEPKIVAQGDYVDGLLLVLNGTARVLQRKYASDQTIKFMHAGDFFGMPELIEAADSKDVTPVHAYGLSTLGHADILRIPTALIEQELIGTMTPDQRNEMARHFAYPDAVIDQGLQEFIGEHHYANGRSAMVIDTSRCVRCDECVSACSRNHDNNPRFIRHGRQYVNLMIANACMHCVDPVCMVGCPTGAISRRIDGEVVINDDTCIGCSTCANSCPYDNIRMVGISDPSGRPAVDERTQAPILKATKCDLCADNLGGPACVRACPHDALTRVDLTDSATLNELLASAANFR